MNVIIPLICIFIFTLGSSYFTSFQSIQLAMDDASQLQIGILQSAFYIGIMLGALYMEPFIRKLGHIKSYALFCFLASSTFLFQGLFPSLALWIGMRFIFGLAISGIYVVIESWLLANSEHAIRGTILSIYMIVLYATQTASHELLNILELNSFAPYLTSTLVCFLSIVPLAFGTLSAPKIESRETPKKFKEIFNLSPLGFMSCLFSGLFLSVIFGFIPVFAYEYGYAVSTLMQITIGGGCLLQWPHTKLSDIYGRSTLIFAASIFTTLSSLAILLFPTHAFMVYPAAFILGGSSFSLYTLGILRVCDTLKAADMVQGNAILLFAYGIGSVLGPLAASFVMDWSTILNLFLYFTLCGAFLILIGIYSQLSNRFENLSH